MSNSTETPCAGCAALAARVAQIEAQLGIRRQVEEKAATRKRRGQPRLFDAALAHHIREVQAPALFIIYDGDEEKVLRHLEVAYSCSAKTMKHLLTSRGTYLG